MIEATITPVCQSCILEVPESITRIQSREKGTTEASTTRRVSFSDVSIRSHDVICTGVISQGPSIGLDWFYSDKSSVSLDVYEDSRLLYRKQSTEGLKLSGPQRKTLLIQKHGYSRRDLMKVSQNRVNSSRRWASPPRTNLKSSRQSNTSALFSTSKTQQEGQTLRTMKGRSTYKLLSRSLL